MEPVSLPLNERLDLTRMLLQKAAKLLQQADQARRSQRWSEVAVWTLQALKAALRALLLFHDVPLSEKAALRRYWQCAVPLASSLELFANRTENLEELVKALADGHVPRVAEREAVLAAWYVARNTLHTVLGELPASVWSDQTTNDR